MNEQNRKPAPRRGASARGSGSSSGASARPAGAQGGAPKKPKKKGGAKRVWANIGRVLVVLVSIGVIVASVLAVMLSLYVVKVTANDASLLNLENLKLSYSSTIYAIDPQTGKPEPYQRLVDNADRIWVDGNQIPDNLKNAFIAVEDKTFRENSGVNFKRTISATANLVLSRLTGGRITLYDTEQGASTITQQLIKNITGDDDRDPLRKVREIFRAISLNGRYSKDTILEAYLNTVGFMGNTCGVQACAYNLYDKDVGQLTLAQCATVAAITNNPTKYNPRTEPENNLQRRNMILGMMLEQGLITQADHDAAVAEPLNLVDPSEKQNTAKVGGNSYFTDMVIDEVITDLVNEGICETRSEASALLFNGGLAIYSTVDTNLQSIMEEVMAKEPGNYYPDQEVEYKDKATGETKTQNVQGAMITIDYTGAVKGVVGGLGEKTADRGLNRAVGSLRQTGSTMKPIGAYALGIDYNYITYSDGGFIDDWVEEINDNGTMRKWPRNYSGKYTEQRMLVCDALANSINTIAVRVGKLVGPDDLFDFMTNTLGITSLVENRTEANGLISSDIGVGPLVLGSMTDGVSLAEMAHAYMMFGDGGTVTPLHSYTTVENVQTGEIVLDNTLLPTTRAIGEDTAMIMNKLLRQVITRGTAAGTGTNTIAGMETVGKTGTTSDDKDHWFIGLTPYYVTATWMGYDQPQELAWKAYGKHPPTLAWKEVMERAQEGLEAKNFPTAPANTVVTKTYCTESGGEAGPLCPSTATGYYKADQPLEPCDIHVG
ncbi:penicillin-binding protein [Anaerofilum sp. BX8]|uniref:Penicillin-binding protein 1A n=1 Tax=Anaerofilum hominis TaxID=2763016 RepID=A0A923IBR3_9FIRM|nr:transglycosylase domain-containing protein [Anaerofilum hominis]MBC5582058.1 penicillin-binding protein [Anaerofilum hominis]